MNKYGIEHFHIELLEETNKPNEREIYWIQSLNSYHSGYNATLGGEGSKKIDHSQVLDLYEKCSNLSEIARQLNISLDSVMDILNSYNIKRKTGGQVTAEKTGIKVDRFDKSGNYLDSFANISQAARFIINNNFSQAVESSIRQHISEVCNKKRKTAYGFIWRKSGEMVE